MDYSSHSILRLATQFSNYVHSLGYSWAEGRTARRRHHISLVRKEMVGYIFPVDAMTAHTITLGHCGEESIVCFFGLTKRQTAPLIPLPQAKWVTGTK